MKYISTILIILYLLHGAVFATTYQVGPTRTYTDLQSVAPLLQPGDVVLTQRKVDEPINIFVQGKSVFWAYPAVCEGQYALLFAQMAQS